MSKYLTFLPLLLACACGGDPQNAAEIADNAANAPANEAVAAEENASGNTLSGPSPRALEVGNLRIPYDAALLAPVETRIPLPPDWKAEAEGVKLIGRDRAPLLGKAECMYGQAGEAGRCNALQEAGLAFAPIDRPFREMAAALPADQRRSVSLAGTEGVSWLVGAEGEGAEYILLPSGDASVLIVRQFRSTGNPDETAIGTVLNDLSFRGE